jgi:hypothetical protein
MEEGRISTSLGCDRLQGEKRTEMKTDAMFSLLFFLLISILTLSGGCATLPNVTETIREVPTAQEPRQIASAKGLLSPKQSKALMERLQRSVDATDMLGTLHCRNRIGE